MALVNSGYVKETPRMSDKIAKEDIVRENANGQQVVVVPAGQPIPEDLDAAVEQTVGIRQASNEEVDEARGKAQAAPAENKAKAAPRKQ